MILGYFWNLHKDIQLIKTDFYNNHYINLFIFLNEIKILPGTGSFLFRLNLYD